MFEPKMASIWTSHTSTFSSDQWLYRLHHFNGLSVGPPPGNIIPVMHNIVSVSICLFVIFKSLCTSLWWRVSCNGSAAGHLTPVCLYYFSAVWSKMVPPLGFATSEFPPPRAPQQRGGFTRWRGSRGADSRRLVQAGLLRCVKPWRLPAV